MTAGCVEMQPAVATPQEHDHGLKLCYIRRKGTAVVPVPGSASHYARKHGGADPRIVLATSATQLPRDMIDLNL